MKKFLFFIIFIFFAHFSAWADNIVTVSYNGNTATVTVDDNVAQYLTVTQSGAHVSIAQSSDLATEIIYQLTGTSTDGEFYMSGSYKATIELNGLTLTNTTPVYSGAAVHIQNSKRINVKVITGTVNTLTDAASGTQKGCLYIKGHAEFKQYGTLNIVGNVKHGIKAGEYVSIKNATINITSALGDGISCNQYFLMESGTVNISGTADDGIQCDLDGTTSTGITVDHEDEDSGNVYVSGGNITIHCSANAAKGITCMGDLYISGSPTIDITTTGNGVWDTDDSEAKAASGISADGNIDISGGTLTLTATGSGGKGMKCDNLMTISGGSVTATTSGGLYYNNGTTENLNYSGNTDQVSSNYYSSAKAIKAGTKTTSGYSTTYIGGIEISGGSISVTTTGKNAEGIESKNYFIVNGGEVTVDAHDDGINAAQDLTITNGYVYARGSANDGIDANGDVFIQGGLIYAIGASSPEVAVDANSEENKKFYFTGGTLIAIGGLERGSSLSQTCYQASTWSTNTWYSMTFGNTVIAFKTPAGGGSPLVVSASSTPTVKSGVTVNGGTSIFEGRCYLDATTSGGSNVSLSEYTSGGGGGNPPGGNSYTITATANPTAGGTVTGAGTYNRFATCTLTATANSGYTFSNWTKNGSVVSTNATYSFTVTANASYVANFTANPYTITANANPAEGGSISGTGSYSQGTTCTLTAVANTGYDFTNWTLNGNQVSTNTSYSFTVTGNANFTANFSALTQHTVTCIQTENGSIIAKPALAYKGETISLVATPDSGYCLGTWTVLDSENNPITVNNDQFIMPDSPVTVSATFVTGYYVTLASVMNGSIDASPTHCSDGSIVTLTATPATGYVFDSWVVYKTGDVNTTITLNGNTFTMPAYDVTVAGIFSESQDDEVSVGSGSSYNNGNYLPTSDYYNYSLTQQIYTKAELGDAGTITAISFYYNTNTNSKARNLQVYMTHTSNTTLSTWVTQSSSSLVFSGTHTFTKGWNTLTLTTPFEYNGTSNILLTVDDNTGSWGTNSYFYTYSTGTNRAIYYRNDSTNPSATGSNTVSPTTSTYNSQVKFTKEVPGTDSYLSLSPTVISGFSYAESEGPSETKTIAVIGRNIESNLTVTAPVDYEISSDGNSFANALSLTPANGSVQTMILVRLKADLDEGLYNDETLVFTAGNTTQNVSLNGEVEPGAGAYYTITTSVQPSEGGTVTGAGRYREFATATLNASPVTGYGFSQWTKDDIEVSTDSSFSFTVTEDAEYVAHFTINQYEISAMANPSNGGTVAGGGTFNHGTSCTLIATANTGYTFAEWTKDGTQVSTNASYTFTVTEAASYMAVFTLNSYQVTATTNPVNGGTITGTGTYPYGTSCTLTAMAADDYSFEAWEEEGNIISTVPTLTFTVESDRTLEATFAPIVQQTQTYNVGWGWVSFYLNLSLEDLENAFEGNASLIKSRNQFVQYENGSWNGNLTSIEVEKMYQINTTGSGTISLNAVAVNPEEHPITLTNGWNWIGYPSPVETTVADAFNGFDSEDGDLLKSHEAMTTFIDGYGWWGTLNKMTPGKGYMFKSMISDEKTLVYSQGSRGMQTHTAKNDNLHWSVDGTVFLNNANIIASIDAKDLTMSEDLEVGAFVNGECRGATRLLYVEPLDLYIAFLTVYGNNEDQIQFMVYDGQESHLMDEQITYKDNLIVGSATHPFVLHQCTGDALLLYPNPVEQGQQIHIALSETTSDVTVEMIDAIGHVIFKGDATHCISTEGMAPGVYTVRITEETGRNEYKKIIIK